MLSSERYVVRVEEPAFTAIASLDQTLRAKFLRTLKILEIDPFVSFTGGFEWVESQAIISLRNAGYPVRRLKARAIGTWRVFYYVDTKTATVLVKEIVKRDEDTYEISSPLFRRLRDNFLQYFQGR